MWDRVNDMSANLTMTSEIEYSAAKVAEEAVTRPGVSHPGTQRALVAAQLLVLLAYGMGMAFLVKTTAGTLVLFSLIAPILIGVALLTMAGVAIYEFRRRHGVHAFEVYDSGQTIFRQGEPGDCAYFIESGAVEMVRHENGSERVIAELTEGDYFGEKALISPAPRMATIRALTQTRVGIIRKRRFLAMVIVVPARLNGRTHRGRFKKKSNMIES